jgi:hypothetical protein
MNLRTKMGGKVSAVEVGAAHSASLSPVDRVSSFVLELEEVANRL